MIIRLRVEAFGRVTGAVLGYVIYETLGTVYCGNFPLVVINFQDLLFSK